MYWVLNVWKFKKCYNFLLGFKILFYISLKDQNFKLHQLKPDHVRGLRSEKNEKVSKFTTSAWLEVSWCGSFECFTRNFVRTWQKCPAEPRAKTTILGLIRLNWEFLSSTVLNLLQFLYSNVWMSQNLKAGHSYLRLPT